MRAKGSNTYHHLGVRVLNLLELLHVFSVASYRTYITSRARGVCLESGSFLKRHGLYLKNERCNTKNTCLAAMRGGDYELKDDPRKYNYVSSHRGWCCIRVFEGVGTRNCDRVGEFECGEEFDSGGRDSLVEGNGGDAGRSRRSGVAGILA